MAEEDEDGMAPLSLAEIGDPIQRRDNEDLILSSIARHLAQPGTIETYTTMSTPALSDLIGYCAAVLTTASFMPQAWHTFRTRDVSGISLGMYSAFTAGVSCWLIYGLLLQAWPIVIANLITLSLAATILMMKLRYR